MTDTHDPETVRILHAFADHGVESEVLSGYGTVTRWTIDPRANPFVDETATVDLMDEYPGGSFDLGLFHPRCTDEANMTSIDGDPSEHENQIPRAREIAEATCDHYIIENKPRDDLRDPVVLNGKQWGMNIKYERAFETTFSVKPPPRERELPTEVSPYFYSDRTRRWWLAEKGYRHPWPKQHLAKNSVPAPYLECLLQSWLKSVGTRDAKPAQDNNGRRPRPIEPDQSELVEAR